MLVHLWAWMEATGLGQELLKFQVSASASGESEETPTGFVLRTGWQCSASSRQLDTASRCACHQSLGLSNVWKNGAGVFIPLSETQIQQHHLEPLA